MKRSYLFFLALSSITARRLRSLITILGIAISLTIITVTLGFAQGLQKIVSYELNQADSTRVITVSSSPNSNLPITDEVVSKIAGFDQVDSIEKSSNLSATITANKLTISLPLYAVSDQYLEKLGTKLVNGTTWHTSTESQDAAITTGSTKKQLILNQAAVSALALSHPAQVIGAPITVALAVPRELATNQTEPTKGYDPAEFELHGIITGTDQPLAYVLQNEVAVTYNITHSSQVFIQAATVDSVATIRDSVSQMGFQTTSVLDTLNQVDVIFRILRVIVVVMGVITLFVAAMGTFNTITVALVEQTREIAFLRILGFTQRAVHRFFILQSILLCFSGAILGLSLGLGAGFAVNYTVGKHLFEELNTPYALFSPSWFSIILLVTFALLLGWIVGLGPSRRAARIEPLDALKSN